MRSICVVFCVELKWNERKNSVFRLIQCCEQEHIPWKDAEHWPAFWCVSSAVSDPDCVLPVDEGCAHVHRHHGSHGQDVHSHRS